MKKEKISQAKMNLEVANMQKIEIVNLRNKNLVRDCKDGIVIRVDRASVLGNPFHMYNESERDAVCDKYQVYFDKKVTDKTDVLFMNELRRIYKIAKNNKVYLACWCAPKRCHAETIKNFIEKYL